MDKPHFNKYESGKYNNLPQSNRSGNKQTNKEKNNYKQQNKEYKRNNEERIKYPSRVEGVTTNYKIVGK